MECHVLWTAGGAICERILGSKWRLPKSWGYPKSSKITQFSDWNNHGDLGIPHFENPKFFPNIAMQMLPPRSQLCPADVGLQGANVCEDPMGGLQPDPLRPPVQAWWNQPKITWMEGVYQEFVIFVFHTLWIPIELYFLDSTTGVSRDSRVNFFHPHQHQGLDPIAAQYQARKNRASDAWILRGKCSMFERFGLQG